ncbi:hypothetical protein NX722_13480 [Endozoicomonas gorgoniicola]|uniref:Uncharacterized protein n=1 Tax=Endozoicomonas gorgoniicola TaxID=1234144 RepID=A0ABT3MXB2_9GAMM|nr:hypothetical protein [Endozoicomonas gorgoniicola]MCW7553619.1 hypothetical protein [Endozoicomonas gorgoniicola]
MSFVNKERFKELIKECVSKEVKELFYTDKKLEKEAAEMAEALFSKLDSFHVVTQEDIDEQNEGYGEDYLGYSKPGDLVWDDGEVYHCSNILDIWVEQNEQYEVNVKEAGVNAMHIYASEVIDKYNADSAT